MAKTSLDASPKACSAASVPDWFSQSSFLWAAKAFFWTATAASSIWAGRSPRQPVKAAIEGRLPRGIGIAKLRDAPPEWSNQYSKLGLPPL
jgi:hypothetical protein